jgi:hypothetical protein
MLSFLIASGLSITRILMAINGLVPAKQQQRKQQAV